jgi:phosphoenolpyruvate synthase/pyruvate phosphate dikinase
MATAATVLWLEECTSELAPLVGGKAAGLAALVRLGVQVPRGFAITTAAYCEFVEHNALRERVERLLATSDTYDGQLRASTEIRKLFEASAPSAHVEAHVRGAYAELCGSKNLPVAVRSSATAEDLADASFAGQQETYLWILGADQVLQHVVRCWASLFTAQAIAYRSHLEQPATDLAMGVVVQRMVPAEAAGVMLTLDPITGDRSTIIIEAAYGLGAVVVNGEVNPDRLCLDKDRLAIRSREIGDKDHAYRFDPSTQGTRMQPVSTQLQRQPCLSDEEVLRLATLGIDLEQAMGRALDIEWAIGPGPSGTREVYLLQARPETYWSRKERTPEVVRTFE